MTSPSRFVASICLAVLSACVAEVQPTVDQQKILRDGIPSNIRHDHDQPNARWSFYAVDNTSTVADLSEHRLVMKNELIAGDVPQIQVGLSFVKGYGTSAEQELFAWNAGTLRPRQLAQSMGSNNNAVAVTSIQDWVLSPPDEDVAVPDSISMAPGFQPLLAAFAELLKPSTAPSGSQASGEMDEAADAEPSEPVSWGWLLGSWAACGGMVAIMLFTVATTPPLVALPAGPAVGTWVACGTAVGVTIHEVGKLF